MTEADIYQFLDGVFRDLFKRGDIVLQADLSAADVVGWDSFRQVEITLALEERYGIRIRTRELDEVANLGDLVALTLGKARTRT
jgi:acyl carrier protein